MTKESNKLDFRIHLSINESINSLLSMCNANITNEHIDIQGESF